MSNTLARLLEREKITVADVKTVAENPHMSGEDSRGMHHYKVRLRRRLPQGARREMTVYFSMGSALCHEPTAADVIECLASDAAGYDAARGFEDWAREYGYDPDSRRAERTYRAVARQARRLERFLEGLDLETILAAC